MTKEQFSVWLVGYLHINVLSRPTAAIEVLKMGDEVLAAAWSVGAVPVVQPVAQETKPLTTGAFDPPPKPRPGDLDYDGPPSTSKGVE